MKYIYDKMGDLISIKLTGTDEEFNQEFGNDIFISEINLGEKAIVKNNIIRAMTKLDRVKANEESLLKGE